MRWPLLIPALCLALTACITPTTDPARLPAGAWSLDPAHASVTWQVRHMGLSQYVGRFDQLDASLDFDPENPQAARLTAIIEAASVSTGDPDFDRDLAEDWFHADRHPQIVFTSSAIEVTSETTGRVSGVLSLNGQSRETVMEVRFYGGAFNILAGRNAIGFAGELVIDRTAFGVGSLPEAIVGRTVTILIEAEFLREGERDE